MTADFEATPILGPKGPRKRGRSESIGSEDEIPLSKVFKGDATISNEPQSLYQPGSDSRKRARSPASGSEEHRPTKAFKSKYFDRNPAPISIEFDGFKIENATLGTLEPSGKIVPLLFQRPRVGTVIDSKGLPTPATEVDDPLNVSYNPSLPESYVVTGEFKLFGLIDSKIQIYQGVITRGQPFSEIVIPVKARLSLGDFIPSLKDGAIDCIAIENPRFQYSEVTFDARQSAGLYFDTDITFHGYLQPVQEILHNFFGQELPRVHVSAYLGQDRDWIVPRPISSLILRGSLDNVSINVLDILTFKTIGVELSMYQRMSKQAIDPVWEFGYGFFGKLHLAIPGSAVPLQVDYELLCRYNRYVLDVILKDDEWKDVFGVKGLNIRDVQMSAMLPELSKDADLDLKVEAALEVGKSTVKITGNYSRNSYGLSAYIGNLTLKDLGEIFTQITGATLDLFDHDVTFNSLYLNVSSEGLAFSGAITINGYSTAKGTIIVSRDGIFISGGIGNIHFEDFVINEAQLDVFIGSTCGKACTRATRFSIIGDLTFSGINLKIGLYTSKASDGKLNWTIYGQAVGDIKTSQLSDALEGSFLDISLKGLAFIASNEENATVDSNVHKYPIGKGLQFCALIDSIPELESLMRGSIKGMVLRASYESGKFRLGLILPGERTISFGDYVYTGPLELEIQTGKDITLVLKAVLNVKLDNQIEPLKFNMGLKANTLGASVYANMLNEWTNPCNVGKNIRISGCALEFGIVYATFFSTGTPGQIGLAGQLNIGRKEAKVAMKLSQNPKEQLLAASVTDLGVVDLVRFASAIADREFPEPDDFLHFNYVDLYISTGATIGMVEYPPGASLKGDMVLFGKRAKFDCTIGSLIKIMATIEPFEIGPLKVKGASQPQPLVDVELSADRQIVLIDGAVELWAASAALHLEARVYPKPVLDLWIDLRLSSLFTCKLQAKLTGDINFKDFSSLSNANFEIYGLMEQSLVDHVMQQLEQQVNSAKEACNEGFDKVKNKMAEAEAEFQRGCQRAIDDLERERKIWTQKKDAVHAEFDAVKASAKAKSDQLKAGVDEAERNFKRLIADLTHDLQRVEADANAAIDSAERDLLVAQRESDDAIREAQADLHRVRDDFNREFGNAVRDLENAKRDVENAERDVNRLQWDIDNLNRRIDDAPWYNCAGLVLERTGVEIAKDVAIVALTAVEGILWTAKGIVEGTGFVAAEGAIGAAELALEGTKSGKNILLEGLRATLEGVREAQHGLIQGAQDALHAAERSSDELHLFDIAKAAVDAGEVVAQQMISAAQASVDGLANCAEFVAFDVAEKALTFAKDNTKELNLARHAVEAAQGVANIGFEIGSWIASHGGQLINLTKIEFSGSIASLIADGPPLIVNIEGYLFGQKIDIHINWQPHFNLVEFIKALFTELWAMIQEMGKNLIKI